MTLTAVKIFILHNDDRDIAGNKKNQVLSLTLMRYFKKKLNEWKTKIKKFKIPRRNHNKYWFHLGFLICHIQCIQPFKAFQLITLMKLAQKFIHHSNSKFNKKSIGLSVRELSCHTGTHTHTDRQIYIHVEPCGFSSGVK